MQCDSSNAKIRKMKPQRWNDWLLLIAVFCFVAAILGNVMLLFGIEQPAYRELQETYNVNSSRPGHFLPAGFVGILRFATTAISLVLGLLFAIGGSIRIPRAATSSRKLRDATWIAFVFAFLAWLGLALF